MRARPSAAQIEVPFDARHSGEETRSLIGMSEHAPSGVSGLGVANLWPTPA
jgi:hypothetical protein